MKKIYITLAVFILSYIPIIFGLNLVHLLAGISWLYLIANFRIVSRILNEKKILVVILLFLLITIYLFFTVSLRNQPINILASQIYLTFEVIPISLMIVIFSKHNNFNIENVLIVCGVIQAAIALITYIFPSVQKILVNELVGYGANDVLLRISSYRMYGFSNSLTFATPALQGIIIFIILLRTTKKDYKFLFAIPIIFFSAVVNARTSIVVILIGIVVILFFRLSKSAPKIVLTFLSIVFLFLLSSGKLAVLNLNTDNETVGWIINGLNEIIGFLNGEYESGYFAYVTNESKYTLPKGLKLVFGEGYRVMLNNPSGFRSDIGYVNDLWLGGLIFVCLMYSTVFILLKNIRNILNNKKNNVAKSVFYFFLITLISLNFKGFIFNFNSVMNVLMLMYFDLICLNKNSEYMDEENTLDLDRW